MNNFQYNFYEFLSYIFPGFTFLGAFIYFVSKFNLHIWGYLNSVDAGWSIVIFLAISFVVGHLIQGVSTPIEKLIYKLEWGGYPSEKLLQEDDNYFSKEYKQLLRQKISTLFKLSNKSKPQEIFYSCYHFLIQKGAGQRIERLLAMHGFYRGMMTMCGVSTIIFFLTFLGIREFELAIATIIFLFSTLVFYKRFLRFSFRFAESVYKEFFILNL